MRAPSSSGESCQRTRRSPDTACSASPSAASAARTAARSPGGTAVSTQSAPTSSSSAISTTVGALRSALPRSSSSPTSARAARLASSTRPVASSASSGAWAASSQRRASPPPSLWCSRYCASWPPTVANSADTSAFGSLTPAEKNSITPAQRSATTIGNAAAVISPARRATGPRGSLPSAPTSVTQAGRRNAQTRPGRPRPAANTVSRDVSLSATTSGGALAGCQVPMQRSSPPSSDGRQTAPKLQPSVSPSVASTRVTSSRGSSPAATSSVTACWASSSRCAPPTRRLSRVASSARIRARGSSEGSGTTAAAPSRPRMTALRSPLRTNGETARKGRWGSASRHELERLARRHRVRPVAAVEHRTPAAPLQGGGQLARAVGVLGPHAPARVLERTHDRPRVRRRHVEQQRTQ